MGGPSAVRKSPNSSVGAAPLAGESEENEPESRSLSALYLSSCGVIDTGATGVNATARSGSGIGMFGRDAGWIDGFIPAEFKSKENNSRDVLGPSNVKSVIAFSILPDNPKSNVKSTGSKVSFMSVILVSLRGEKVVEFLGSSTGTSSRMPNS